MTVLKIDLLACDYFPRRTSLRTNTVGKPYLDLPTILGWWLWSSEAQIPDRGSGISDVREVVELSTLVVKSRSVQLVTKVHDR